MSVKTNLPVFLSWSTANNLKNYLKGLGKLEVLNYDGTPRVNPVTPGHFYMYHIYLNSKDVIPLVQMYTGTGKNMPIIEFAE